jgi:hypothetical protein
MSHLNTPNLRKFVKENIVPDELRNMKKVIDVYVRRILDELQKEYTGLDSLIHSISPYPTYIDSGSSVIMNNATTELTGSDIVKKLKIALEKDNIKFDLEIGDGF